MRGIVMTFDDIAGLIYETTCTAHLACSPETGEVDPSGPVSIIAADGSKATKVLLPGELELFAGEKKGTFEAELVNDSWRLIRRIGTN
jgi:hypothetical protein